MVCGGAHDAARVQVGVEEGLGFRDKLGLELGGGNLEVNVVFNGLFVGIELWRRPAVIVGLILYTYMSE